MQKQIQPPILPNRFPKSHTDARSQGETREIPDKNGFHIGFYLPNLAGGGAEKMVIHLASNFAGLGSRVDLVLIKAEGVYLPLVSSQINVINLRATNAYTSLLGLYRYLLRQRPNFLISSLDLTNLIALLARRASRLSTRCIIQIVSTVSLQKRSWMKKKLERLAIGKIYPWADAIIAVSHGVSMDLATYAGIPAQKIHTIYSPIITEGLYSAAKAAVKHPWFNQDQIPVILAAGRLSPAKDFSLLLRAFALVREKRDARLVILGEGEERSRLTRLAEALGVSADVDLPGFVQNPYAFMRRAAVFVLSSSWEGLPNVLVEAMACGCPVVSTDCPSGPAEILAGGRYGHLVPVGDEVALAQAIEEVLLGDIRRPPPEWHSQFKVEEVAQRYLNVMRQLLIQSTAPEKSDS